MNPPAASDRPVAAAALMMLGVLAGTGIDNLAKWVLTDHPLSQFVLLRSVGATAFMLVAALVARRRVWVTQRLGWHLARTIQRRNRAAITAVLDAEAETPIVPGV